ncbi:MAG: hypothetical protein M5U34_05940 [Chloroflexi bacterium]|nr:hypothetical protein [Chloroflexota bacterium]
MQWGASRLGIESGEWETAVSGCIAAVSDGVSRPSTSCGSRMIGAGAGGAGCGDGEAKSCLSAGVSTVGGGVGVRPLFGSGRPSLAAFQSCPPRDAYA